MKRGVFSLGPLASLLALFLFVFALLQETIFLFNKRERDIPRFSVSRRNITAMYTALFGTRVARRAASLLLGLTFFSRFLSLSLNQANGYLRTRQSLDW